MGVAEKAGVDDIDTLKELLGIWDGMGETTEVPIFSEHVHSHPCHSSA